MNNQESSNWIERTNAAYMEKVTKIIHGPFLEKTDEIVLCFPADVVKHAIACHGDEQGSSYAIATQIGPFAELRPRGVLENNPDYIHAIVYIAVRKGNSIYVYSRGKTGSEDKLQDRASVGFGGHVGLRDVEFCTYIESFDIPDGMTQEEYQQKELDVTRKDGVSVIQSLIKAFRRELKEEVNIQSYTGNPKSDVLTMSMNTKIIYFNTGNPGCVHGVHLAFLSVVDIPEFLDDAILSPNENEGLGWYPISEETIDKFPGMEEWSKITIRALVNGSDFAMTLEEAEEHRLKIYESALAGIAEEEEIGAAMLQRIKEQRPELAEIAEQALLNPTPMEESSEVDDILDGSESDVVEVRSDAFIRLIELTKTILNEKVIVDPGIEVTFVAEDDDMVNDLVNMATNATLQSSVDGHEVTVLFPRGTHFPLEAASEANKVQEQVAEE